MLNKDRLSAAGLKFVYFRDSDSVWMVVWITGECRQWPQMGSWKAKNEVLDTAGIEEVIEFRPQFGEEFERLVRHSLASACRRDERQRPIIP